MDREGGAHPYECSRALGQPGEPHGPHRRGSDPLPGADPAEPLQSAWCSSQAHAVLMGQPQTFTH